MFGRESVLRDPELIRATNREPVALIEELIRQLRSGRGVPVRDAPGVPRLRYPRAPASYDGVRRAIERRVDGAPAPTIRVQALQKTLMTPRLGLRLSPGVGEDDVERAMMVQPIASQNGDPYPVLFATVTLDARESGRTDQASVDLSEEWLNGDDVDEVTLRLEQSYVEGDPAYHDEPHISGRRLRRVILVGAVHEPGDWQRRMSAAARARDLDVVFVDGPAELREPQLRAALRDGAPVARVLLLPYLGHAGMIDRIRALAGEDSPIVAIEDTDFDPMVAAFRRVLDTLPANEPVADLIVGRDPPGSGEVRFYKKNFSTPSRDVMVEVRDRATCAWTAAPGGAPKARKGITAYTGREPEALWHCDRCEGGGHWQARF